MNDDIPNGMLLDKHAKLLALAESIRSGFPEPDAVTVTNFTEWKTDEGMWRIEIRAIWHEQNHSKVFFVFERSNSKTPWGLLHMSQES